jgi:hydrogenase maturation protease
VTGRTLVAGIGNIFLGDDGFGVEVVRRLAERPARPDACIVDFGIRGIDLSHALMDFERAILVDATPRGRAPGTLYVLEPALSELDDGGAFAGGGHGVVPTVALSMARALGGRLRYLRVVGCEPARVPDDGDIDVGLSEPVAAAVDGAVALVEELLEAAHA